MKVNVYTIYDKVACEILNDSRYDDELKKIQKSYSTYNVCPIFYFSRCFGWHAFCFL